MKNSDLIALAMICVTLVLLAIIGKGCVVDRDHAFRHMLQETPTNP